MNNTKKILKLLYDTYPNAHCELNYGTPFELLVSTVLSAQTTDKKVNQVTKTMFEKWNTPKDFAVLNQADLENEIKEIGLYRNKSKNIISLSKSLIENHNGMVPSTMEELMSLDGVGRKTANVVLSNAFNIPAIAVDTHVFRVSNRLGIANSDNVTDTETQLMEAIPKKDWSKAHHTLIFHGRNLCPARKPKCEECPVHGLCKYFTNKGLD